MDIVHRIVIDQAPGEKSLPIPVQAAEVLRQELGVLQGHLKRAKIMFMMMVVVWEILSMVTLLTFLTLYWVASLSISGSWDSLLKKPPILTWRWEWNFWGAGFGRPFSSKVQKQVKIDRSIPSLLFNCISWHFWEYFLIFKTGFALLKGSYLDCGSVGHLFCCRSSFLY